MFPLLNCCAGAAVNRLGKFLVSLVPGADALIEVVEFGADVWERWKKQKPGEADRREELQALAHASPERVEAAVQAAIQAEAAGQPAAVKRKLTTYLTQVQVAVRRTVCRPADPEGRTVPADLRLNSAEDLRPFLPPQLPRFEPGELKSPPTARRRPAPARSPRDSDRDSGGGGVRRPPRRGVPGWVWLAGSAAAVMVVVAVVLVLRNGSRPKTPDGPPVAAKAPDGPSVPAKAPSDADKAKDTEPDRKKDKKDKTDTPEKPAPLPRLVAFPKLSLLERGAADLQVKVERQGYAGPIKLQVENLPPGVTCQRLATIPAGESALRLEFRTDGTAAEGTATVEVIATADTRTADRQNLALLFPPKSAASAKPPEPLPKSFKNALGMEFVLVPKGRSWLGGGGGKPGDKEVEIPRDFYLGKYTVTQEQWESVMGKNPSSFSRNGKNKDQVKGISDAEVKRFPVENVSWLEVQDFLNKLNASEKDVGWKFCLPTEAEWEYACRGGAVSKADCGFDYYFDQPTNDLDSTQANFIGDQPTGKGLKGPYLARPCPVGSYKPNRLGLYDMNGNVRQWCDGLSESDGSGRSSPVVRGGSWHGVPENCRAAFRCESAPDERVEDRGFRLARVPVSAKKK